MNEFDRSQEVKRNIKILSKVIWRYCELKKINCKEKFYKKGNASVNSFDWSARVPACLRRSEAASNTSIPKNIERK